MRPLSLLLAAAVGLLTMPIEAPAQQASTFSRPAVTLRGGAMQTVNENTGGLAPYVEAQSKVNLGNTPFGLALYGGISYERSKRSSRICPFVPPCFDTTSRRMHLDLVTGIRFGAFPQHGPVDAFVGIASHFVHRTEDNEPFEDRERWSQHFTLEGGMNAQIPVTRRFGIDLGVLGFLPVRVGDGAVHIGEWEPSDADEAPNVDMSRVGFHVGMQYEL